MSIIAKIRQFIQLDKNTLSLENKFVNSVGLYVHELVHLKEIHAPSMDCLGPYHHYSIYLNQDSNQPIHLQYLANGFDFHHTHFSHC